MALHLPPRAGEHHLDEALVYVHTTAPSWQGALANHAPMAAEALVALGRADSIAEFLSGYADKLEPAVSAPMKPLAEWTTLRGSRAACPRLIAHFEICIQHGGVVAVVGGSVPQLFPGVLGAAFHGLLRLAHALRAWRHQDNAVRRREIAIALGYWASEYTPLVGEVGASGGADLSAVQALQQLPPLPPQHRLEGPSLMVDRAIRCDLWPAFHRHIARVDLERWTVARTLSACCGAAAVFLLGGHARFAYLHIITAGNALREVLPFLTAAQQRLALGHYWHALAALHAASQPVAAPSISTHAPPSDQQLRREVLIERALLSLDDHAIKLTAAALHEHQISADRRLLEAAWLGA